MDMEVVLGVVLFGAVVCDLRTRRIPNWLNLGAAVSGVALHAWHGGAVAAAVACGGLAVGLVCFLPNYLFGALGGGDVKLMAATGTFLGPSATVIAALAAVLAGGALALMRIAWRGGLQAMATRYGTMVMIFVASRRLVYLAPAAGEPAGERFPYAIAIAAGTAAVAWIA